MKTEGSIRESRRMDQPIRRRSESLSTSGSPTPLTRSLAHTNDDVLPNLLKVKPIRVISKEIVDPRRNLTLSKMEKKSDSKTNKVRGEIE